jgi:hypothetical protein
MQHGNMNVKKAYISWTGGTYFCVKADGTLCWLITRSKVFLNLQWLGITEVFKFNPVITNHSA